ncbi:MAG TPA: glycine oxidase ThiO [Acidimicrobiales bacterium]|nr:glycine oxidase ThiO [Acidimicrobiales bacterium]
MSPDVVVVGGGVIGLASAWRLAQRGASVAVVDPEPGGGASGVAAGMIAPVTEARHGEEPLLRLNLASWARWPAFADELVAAAGRPIGFRADGTLLVAFDADDRAQLDEIARRHRAMGLTVAPLRGRAARAEEPGLAPGVRAGLLAADERSVDPPALVEALRHAATRAGVALRPAAVARIDTTPDGRRVTGVSLAGGEERVAAATVVLAAGCHSADVAGLPAAARPPVRPVKGQILTLRQPPGAPLVTRTVRGLVRGAGVYLVPRDDGRVVVGATMEERGWDTRATAGGAYELLRDALALVPGLDDAELVAVRTGLRPGSPDDLPMVGPSAVDGLVVATGHHRNGILLTPVTADAVAAAVLGEAGPAEVAACDPRRFAGAAVPAEAPA